jgi:uncharacterized protein YkwD
MRIFILLFSLIFIQSTSFSDKPDAVCITSEEKKLYDLMMAYRKKNKLPPIPLSPKLTLVAQMHARDLAENFDFQNVSTCNPHSWSNKGQWTSCCYTNDHKEAKCMWDKPKEIAGYESAGYEIAYFSSRGATAEEGLAGWQKSTSHNPVILNEGIWAKATWNAIGIGFYKEYGVVWFGEQADETPVIYCTDN